MSPSDFRGKYLRQLPAVGKLIEHPKLKAISETCPRVLLSDAIRDVLEGHKAEILTAGDEEQVRNLDLSIQQIVDEVSSLAAQKAWMSLRRAINATGNVLPENLGRAPLNEAAQRALQDVARGYSTLAVEPGDRDAHVQSLLSILTGAEAGLVLNNNAAAVMLILNTIADGKEVVVSRGQMIESDSFRLPEVIAKSGAIMVSVGATNKTHLYDYHNAIGEDTAAIMRVHKSNYRIAGFSQDVPLQELVELGRQHDIPVIDDIGSGCLVDLTQHGLPEDPPAFLSIRNGADIVCFSGDKLLSGPQSGIVIGRQEYISMMKKNPLYRILRVGKLTMAALEATLRLYLDSDRILELSPAFRLLTRPLEEIEAMTESLVDSLTEKLRDLAVIHVQDGYSRVGAIYSAPEKFPTKLIFIKPEAVSVDKLNNRLHLRELPILVLVGDEQLVMDLRTVQEDELDEIATGLAECCQLFG
jgi:L-seryl-tRNA(Ser) seleniumtransferase